MTINMTMAKITTTIIMTKKMTKIPTIYIKTTTTRTAEATKKRQRAIHD